MAFINKKILIMGLGLFGGGVAATRYFVEKGAQVTVTDLRKQNELSESLDLLASLPVKLHLGKHHPDDFRNADMIVVNPGVPGSSPYLKIAQQHNVSIETEINIVLRQVQCPVIGITGSNGKSTTTAMIAHILREAGFRTWLGGNIGKSLLPDLPKIKKNDRVVLELSSFQLERVHTSPHIAIITNLSKNHLDRHGCMEEYAHAKQNILRFQQAHDICILNGKDRMVREWGQFTLAKTIFFAASNGTYIHKGNIVYKQGNHFCQVMPIDNIPLPGAANQENAMAAISAAIAQEIPIPVIAKALQTFSGLPHRLEFLGNFAQRKIYNDSDSTTPESTIAGIQALTGPIILLAGGSDKGLDYSSLGQELGKRVKLLILYGQTAAAIKNATHQANNNLQIMEVEDLEQAVQCAYKFSTANDQVVLSPASASFGMFRNFVERGQIFAKLINKYFR